MLKHFLHDENATTAIEYTVIAGLIALALIAALGLAGDELAAIFKAAAEGFGG